MGKLTGAVDILLVEAAVHDATLLLLETLGAGHLAAALHVAASVLP